MKTSKRIIAAALMAALTAPATGDPKDCRGNTCDRPKNWERHEDRFIKANIMGIGIFGLFYWYKNSDKGRAEQKIDFDIDPDGKNISLTYTKNF